MITKKKDTICCIVAKFEVAPKSNKVVNSQYSNQVIVIGLLAWVSTPAALALDSLRGYGSLLVSIIV